MLRLPTNGKKRTLSSQMDSSIVTLRQNVANVLTPVAEFRVPDNTTFLHFDATEVRGQVLEGAHLVLDLRAAAAALIDPASRVAIGKKRPSDPLISWSTPFPYTIFRELTRKDQIDENFIPQILQTLNYPAPNQLYPGLGIMAFDQGDLLVLGLEAPTQIVWTASNSYCQFDVREFNNVR